VLEADVELRAWDSGAAQAYSFSPYRSALVAVPSNERK